MEWTEHTTVSEYRHLRARTWDGWELGGSCNTDPCARWSVSVESPDGLFNGLFMSSEVESEADAKRWCEAALAVLREFRKTWGRRESDGVEFRYQGERNCMIQEQRVLGRALELVKEKKAKLESENERLREENAELREWKADVEDAFHVTMDERCTEDEQHCTCVPHLRRRIKELEAQLASAVPWDEHAEAVKMAYSEGRGQCMEACSVGVIRTLAICWQRSNAKRRLAERRAQNPRKQIKVKRIHVSPEQMEAAFERAEQNAKNRVVFEDKRKGKGGE